MLFRSERGMVLAKPKSITPHTKFKAEIYVLAKEEGGRHTPFFIEKSKSASCSNFLIFDITWWLALSIVAISNFPVSGFNGIWPLIKSIPFAYIAGLYGPIGAGAFGILIAFLSIVI